MFLCDFELDINKTLLLWSIEEKRIQEKLGMHKNFLHLLKQLPCLFLCSFNKHNTVLMMLVHHMYDEIQIIMADDCF